MKAKDLGLVGRSLLAATEIERRCSAAVFLSGKRTRTEQARAMAANCVRTKRAEWIRDTYSSNKVSSAAYAFAAAAFKHARGVPSVESVMLAILAAMSLFTDAELEALSKHLGARAFDLQTGNLTVLAVTKEVTAKYGGKLITNEGGLNRLHAEFTE